jgi:hypothetical protein
MIYPTLNSKINTILSGVSAIRQVYAYPTAKITAYPAAIFFPQGLENSFETTVDNFKIYTYKLYLVIGAKQKGVDTIFSTIMPALVDETLQAIDDGWNFDTIDGHRAWTKVETGSWSVSDEQAGLEVTAEFTLSVKLLTS